VKIRLFSRGIFDNNSVIIGIYCPFHYVFQKKKEFIVCAHGVFSIWNIPWIFFPKVNLSLYDEHESVFFDKTNTQLNFVQVEVYSQALTQNTEHGTIQPVLHLSVRLFRLFLRYPTYIPPISHLYPISYKRWVIGGLSVKQGRVKE